MLINKAPNLEQLIKIAKEHKKELLSKDTSEELNDASRFVLAFDIREGKHKILSSTIFKVYQLWSSDPISKLSFFKQFGAIFKPTRKGNASAYLLNYHPGELLNAVTKLQSHYD